jgi:two-component system response regulator AtoC
MSSQPVVVADPAMEAAYVRLHRAAVQPLLNILVLGEAGVGKSLIGEEILRLSASHVGRCLRIHCRASGDALAALASLAGANEEEFLPADAIPETVLLDGVGELDAALQRTLLGVLDMFDERGQARKGSAVRFVSVANQSLPSDLARGAFRSDLFFRLGGVSILVPPLRERRAAIVPLAESFLESAAHDLGLDCLPTFSADALTRLQERRWPGNVRELRNVVARAALFWSGVPIRAEDLTFDELGIDAAISAAPTQLATMPLPSRVATATSPAWGAPGDDPLQPRVRASESRETRAVEERARILAALEMCHGNQTRAASLLGMPRRTLVAKLTAYAIPRPRKAC